MYDVAVSNTNRPCNGGQIQNCFQCRPGGHSVGAKLLQAKQDRPNRTGQTVRDQTGQAKVWLAEATYYIRHSKTQDNLELQRK